MKIEMNLSVMAKLINQGIITPSEVRCLDEESKQQLRELCLDLCKPSQCATCDAQLYCSKGINKKTTSVENHAYILSPDIQSALN